MKKIKMKGILALLFMVFGSFVGSEILGQSVAVMQAQVNIVSGSSVQFLHEEADSWDMHRFIINSPDNTQIVAAVAIPQGMKEPIPVVQSASQNGAYVIVLGEEADIDLSKVGVALTVNYL